MSKVAVKKTGHEDIDTLLEKAYDLLEEGERLQENISVSLKFKPISPSTSRQARLKRFKKFSSKINS